jgi:hypothetical protein
LEISLIVKDAKAKDVGKDIGRINPKALEELKIKSGYPITLKGKGKTSVIAELSSEDQNEQFIRIDGFVRHNAGVEIGDVVKVSQARVQDAERIMLSPVEMRLNVDSDFTNFVKSRLIDRTLTKGDTTLVMMLGHAIPFEVARVIPIDEHFDCVQLTPDTDLVILNEPISSKTKVGSDVKMLFRHEWLKNVSLRLNAEKTAFSIIGTEIEKENESDILDIAKDLADKKWQQVDVVVKFYSSKGDLIGDLHWITIDTFGDQRAVYPDIKPLTVLEYPRIMDQSMLIPTSTMRRCFKTGLKRCPKEINFSPKLVFVAIPFRSNFQDLYKYAIRPALEDMDFKIWKADERISNIDMMCKICYGLQECSYVIANISDWNPNVLFEIGLAYGFGKDVVLIKDRKESVPVDLKGLEYIDYDNIDELKRNITAFFKSKHMP